jgi:dienelactone hydrolase
MKMKLMVGLALLAFPIAAKAQVAPPTAAQPVVQPTRMVVPLWPNGAPGFEARKDLPEQAADYWVKSINNPSLTVFLPPKEKATGAAVILCAGGGFRELGFVPEGLDAGEYFKNMGVAAFALKYRLPREPGSPYNMTHPREDGLRAMRLVRSRAAEWGIDPNRIGMVGFSAGGEVVSLTTFGGTDGDPNAPDPIDRLSARPDFIAEIYPGGGGIPQTLPPNAPTAFLLVANDDNGHVTPVLDLFRLYRAARRPVEVHVLTKGAHAFNLGKRSKLASINTWPQRMADWMADNNILDPAVPAKGVL